MLPVITVFKPQAKEKIMSDSIVGLQLVISDASNDPERIDIETQDLMNSLKEFKMYSIEKEQKQVKNGEKGGAIEIGSVFLEVAKITIPALLSFLAGWVMTTRKVKIKAPNGAEIEFTGTKVYTESEIIGFSDTLNKIKNG
jgi:hypothetical protein